MDCILMKVTLGKYPKKFNQERKIKIQIDKWDTWSMDHTLALIIHPMLVQLQATKHGAPLVDDEDVPEELRSTSAPPLKHEHDTDDNFHKRWDWVLDEMIWTFAQKIDDNVDDQFHSGETDILWRQVDIDGNVVNDTLYKSGEEPFSAKKDDNTFWEMIEGPNHTHKFDKEGWEKWNARKSNGFRLFGKYFEALWD
jgi:hypothetical protein